MNAPVYNWQGNAVGEIELSDEIFSTRWNPDLVHQVLAVQIANRREPLAHTKGRGEVRGGGRKPWRQKGTGRARHGSIRSPLWAHGGVAHGPTKEKKFEKRINAKMVRGAIHAVLSKKLKDQELKILESFPTGVVKTKEMAKSLRAFPRALMITPQSKRELHRAVRNIPKVKAIPSHAVNVYDLLRYPTVLIDRMAISEIK